MGCNVFLSLHGLITILKLPVWATSSQQFKLPLCKSWNSALVQHLLEGTHGFRWMETVPGLFGHHGLFWKFCAQPPAWLLRIRLDSETWRALMKEHSRWGIMEIDSPPTQSLPWPSFLVILLISRAEHFFVFLIWHRAVRKHVPFLRVLTLAQKAKPHIYNQHHLNNSLGKHCFGAHITFFHETNTVGFLFQKGNRFPFL